MTVPNHRVPQKALLRFESAQYRSKSVDASQSNVKDTRNENMLTGAQSAMGDG
jgi:hypothetical protein